MSLLSSYFCEEAIDSEQASDVVGRIVLVQHHEKVLVKQRIWRSSVNAILLQHQGLPRGKPTNSNINWHETGLGGMAGVWPPNRDPELDAYVL